MGSQYLVSAMYGSACRSVIRLWGILILGGKAIGDRRVGCHR